ncbi:MAG TPA: aminomethyltransferase family protein [Thermoplasmata archaeon]
MQDLPLQTLHDVAGAILRPEGEWNVPSGYVSLDEEVRAVRTRAGVIDVSDRAKIELTGSERVLFLDGLVTADIKVLTPGASAYALLLNEKSRVLGDVRVYAFPESLVLDIEAAQKPTILGILEKARVSDDVEFRDLGPTGHLVVHGPRADDVVVRALGADVRALSLDIYASVRVDKRHVGHVARIRPTGERGFAIWSPGATLADAWAALVRRGATPIGREAYEVLRIEAGVPRFGADMSGETLALEVAPESALSFTKGCYVGQETVARSTYVGQVRRKLLGLRIDADTPPVRGDPVLRGDQTVGGVTSAAWSPTLGWGVALALVRVDAVSPTETLFVDRGGWSLRAKLHPLPFVRPGA